MGRGKFYFFLFIGVILAMVTLQVQLQHRLQRKLAAEDAARPTVEQMIKPVTSSKSAPLFKDPEQKQRSPEQQKMEETVSAEFLELIKKESELVGRPQGNIDELENRLQSWARHLNQDEINYLAYVVKDRSRGGDERALALDLLGRNQSSESLSHLKDFVLTDLPQSGGSKAQVDEEVIFKVQAVEEIAASSSSNEAISYLNEIQRKSDHSFVKDRAQRSLSHLKGLAPSMESQDNEALKKLIK